VLQPCALFSIDNPLRVFGFVRKNLERGAEISYLTTLAPEDLIAKVVEYWPEVRRYIESGNLSIRSASTLFPAEIAGTDINESREISETQNSHSADRIALICPSTVTACIGTNTARSSSDSTESTSQIFRIVKFEAAVYKRFSASTVICCVFNHFLQGLDLLPLLILARHHTLIVTSDGRIIPMSEHHILDAIKRGIDATLGVGISVIILKTLAYVYKIDESTILQDPVYWILMLKKVIGNEKADQVINASAEELKKSLFEQFG
jgi:hypothetical protein